MFLRNMNDPASVQLLQPSFCWGMNANHGCAPFSTGIPFSSPLFLELFKQPKFKHWDQTLDQEKYVPVLKERRVIKSFQKSKRFLEHSFRKQETGVFFWAFFKFFHHFCHL